MTKLMLPFSLQDGRSALMMASGSGHSEIVKYLAEAKASVHLQKQLISPSNPWFYITLNRNTKAYYKLFLLSLIFQRSIVGF